MRTVGRRLDQEDSLREERRGEGRGLPLCPSPSRERREGEEGRLERNREWRRRREGRLEVGHRQEEDRESGFWSLGSRQQSIEARPHFSLEDAVLRELECRECGQGVEGGSREGLVRAHGGVRVWQCREGHTVCGGCREENQVGDIAIMSPSSLYLHHNLSSLTSEAANVVFL